MGVLSIKLLHQRFAFVACQPSVAYIYAGMVRSTAKTIFHKFQVIVQSVHFLIQVLVVGISAFYGAVFGWETEPFGPATLWRLPGFVGGEPEQPVARDVVAVAMPGDQSRWDVDLWVDDPDATAEKASQLGGTVLMAPMDTPMGRRAVLADPQGGTFSVSRVSPA